MKSHTKVVWEGEACGPVDWDHPTAKDMPDIWREAEQSPGDFIYVDDFATRVITDICMYDGWPYWKPTPAIRVWGGPCGAEWKFFTSYGVRPSSIRRKGARA